MYIAASKSREQTSSNFNIYFANKIYRHSANEKKNFNSKVEQSSWELYMGGFQKLVFPCPYLRKYGNPNI